MKRLDILRAAALIAGSVGAAGSMAVMLRVGHRNQSRLLLGLFTIWVLSPFVALVWAIVASKLWPAFTRAALYGVTLVLALGSLAIYGDVAFGPRRATPAAAFLMVPLASWLLIAMVAAIGYARRSHHSTRSPG